MFRIGLCALLLASACPALAAGDDEGVDDAITVVASGSAKRVDRSGQAIAIVTRAEIDSAQGIDAVRALERVPGLAFSRNGGPGSFTGVRLRGSDAEQVLVLLDGVRLEDVSAPSGGFDFGTVAAGGIERIEVLRGSNSVPWGSAALGGVIAMTSRAPDGAEASIEYGGHETFASSAAAGVVTDRAQFGLSGGYARSDGVSAASAGTEPDGFRTWHLGARGRANLTPSLAVKASARLADTRTQIDGFGPPLYLFGDTAEFQDTRQLDAYAGVEWQKGALDLATGAALSTTGRTYFDPALSGDPSYSYDGEALRWDMRGRLRLQDGWTIDFGADSEWSRFSSTFDAPARANLASGHALLGREWQTGAVTLGARRDEHSGFGGTWSLGANGAWQIADAVLLRASFGEGFKAPTLFQLLSEYGNAALAPERSDSFDLGVALGQPGSGVSATATLFRRNSRNLIAFVSCASLDRCADRPFGLYDNIARARAEGVELELRARPIAGVALLAVYSFTDAANRTPASAFSGNDLPRRPRQALSLAADWAPGKGRFTVGADLRAVGRSFDDAANLRRLDSHVLLALRGKVALTGGTELFGRIENVLDARYETVADYGTWGRTAFLGVRSSF